MYIDAIQSILDELRRCRLWIEAALEYTGGTHTFDDVCHMVMIGRVKFWPQPESFLITEVLDYPRIKVYHVWLAGGDLQEITGTLPAVVAAARDAQCQTVSCAGRQGWTKVLAKLGWKHSHTTLQLSVAEYGQGRQADNGSRNSGASERGIGIRH
jgi:hypothetical protein